MVAPVMLAGFFAPLHFAQAAKQALEGYGQAQQNPSEGKPRGFGVAAPVQPVATATEKKDGSQQHVTEVRRQHHPRGSRRRWFWQGGSPLLTARP